MASAPLAPLAVSLGDPAGIGPEVVAKCWDHRAGLRPAAVRRGRRRAHRSSAVWDGPIAADRRPARRRQRVRRRPAAPPHPVAPRPTCPAARASPARIARSTRSSWRSAWRGRASAVGGGHRPGQQAAALRASASPIPARPNSSPSAAASRPANVAMMLAGPTLRTVPVTTHMPLAEVAGALTAGADRGARPRHPARPAAQFRDRRAAARGRRRSTPMPAKAARSAARRSTSSCRRSTRCAPKAGRSPARCPPTPCSTPRARSRYDAALCMYHDQALIPLEGAAFRGGRQHHARPADRPHRARPWHRVRHRRRRTAPTRARWPRRSAWPQPCAAFRPLPG